MAEILDQPAVLVRAFEDLRDARKAAKKKEKKAVPKKKKKKADDKKFSKAEKSFIKFWQAWVKGRFG